MTAEIIPRHQWTHDGADVLIVRYVAKDGSSSHGFVYPLTVGADVLCPDWEPTAECGHGLHGWAWGFSIGEGADPDGSATWLVIAAKPADVIAIEGKVKFRGGVVRHVGDWQSATSLVLPGQMAWVHHAAKGASSSTGYGAASSSTGARAASSSTGARAASSSTGAGAASSSTGDWAASSSTGDWAASSSTGDRAASSSTGDVAASSSTGDGAASSSTGYGAASSSTGYGAASSSTGYGAASSSTGYGAASSSTGDGAASSSTGYGAASSSTGRWAASSSTGAASAAVVTGDDGKARAGEFGVIALAFYNQSERRMEMRCARTGGDGGLKPHTWYRLNGNGEFVECI